VPNNKNLLLEKFYEENSFVASNIASYNNFVDVEIQRIVDEMGEIIPTITPPEIKEFKIKLDKVTVTKPWLIEADGSKRPIYPSEARIRKLTYSAPVTVEINAIIEGVQRESFSAHIGNIPVMLKSKYCHLIDMKRDELINHGEDPDDPGGYFILNGNERLLITVEDLIPNKLFVQKAKVGASKFVGKLFSERGALRIPHTIEQMKDGIIYLTFTRFKRIPIINIIKALGLVKDKEIMDFISDEKQYDDVYLNLYNSINIKSENDALETLSNLMMVNQPKEVKLQKTRENLDRYLLPHLGTTPKEKLIKAINLCKMIKKFLLVSRDNLKQLCKDHYMNKKLKLSGDLLADLFRVNMRVLIDDILYNYQRLVKRGKFHSLRILVREKLLTSRIQSAMATGIWTGGRKGISQNIDRTNFLATLSHLQRVVSLLSTSQENFEARELHATHWGRLCCIETPEGTSIGLRKNLANLTTITQEEVQEDKIKKSLEALGLKVAR